MRALRPGLDDAEATGRLRLLHENDVYLDASGRIRSIDGIIDFWLKRESDARAQGFQGLRITGDGTGLVSSDSWATGVDYERRADAAFRGRRIVAYCTYSLPAVSPARLAEVLSGHGSGLIRRNGAWDEVRSGAGVAAAIEILGSFPG